MIEALTITEKKFSQLSAWKNAQNLSKQSVRQNVEKINRDNMIEEIADVLICIEMLKQMYMISHEKINKWIEKKQAREAERIGDINVCTK